MGRLWLHHIIGPKNYIVICSFCLYCNLALNVTTGVSLNMSYAWIFVHWIFLYVWRGRGLIIICATTNSKTFSFPSLLYGMKKRKKNVNGQVFNQEQAYRCYPFALSYFKIHFTLKVFWDNFLNVRALPDCNSLSPGPRMMTLFIQQHFSVHAYVHIMCVHMHADFLQVTGSVTTYLFAEKYWYKLLITEVFCTSREHCALCPTCIHTVTLTVKVTTCLSNNKALISKYWYVPHRVIYFYEVCGTDIQTVNNRHFNIIFNLYIGNGPGVAALLVGRSLDRSPVVSLGIFSMVPSDKTMCPEVDSASENEYQGFLLG